LDSRNQNSGSLLGGKVETLKQVKARELKTMQYSSPNDVQTGKRMFTHEWVSMDSALKDKINVDWFNTFFFIYKP